MGKTRRRLSIKLKMALTFASINVLLVSFLAFFSVRNLRTAIIEKVEQELQNKAKDVSALLDERIRIVFSNLQGIARANELRSVDATFEERALYLKTVEKEVDGVLDLSIADLEGKLYTGGKKTIDIRGDTCFPFIQKGQCFMSEPFISGLDSALIVVVNVPLYDDNQKLIGALNASLSGYLMTDQIKDIVIGKTGNCYIMDQNGVNVAYKDREMVKTRFSTLEAVKTDKSFAEAAAFNKKVLESDEPIIGYFNFKGSNNIACSATLQTTGWKLGIQAPVNEFLGTINSFRLKIILVNCLLVLLSMLAVFVASRSLVLPIGRTAQALKDIAEGEGDLTVRLPVNGNDELSDLQLYFNRTIEKIAKSVKGVGESSAAMEAIANELSNNMSETASAVHQISKNIEGVKSQTSTQATSVTETGATLEEIINTIKNLNGSIETQAASVAQSSSSIEEMVANIASITQSISKANNAIVCLDGTTANGQEAVGAAYEIVKKISEASGGLIEASNIIQNIASQTNLLAMNAAIEAAHAGDAGKGFAVVADEIRKLAEESSTQGKTITASLKELGNNIIDLNEKAAVVAKNFDVIASLSSEVKNSSETVGAAMREQENGSREVLSAIKNINSVTSEVKDDSEEMLRGGEQIAEEMRKLDNLTRIITDSMNEMAAGAVQMNNAVAEVNEITQKNKRAIENLSAEVGKFKI
ncbi:methyl-accepting chemotaxis protein [Treponema phagedenis]|uniref:methyl-accepting chemotaxis protein n=1 Tax=Treponema phagedenis TaxID=162 RepID=UPI0001F63BF4|nr:methyl-accepting chemotaxis protein [Treponema phagedenis]EFW38158.1 HAMP domain protein [Treponema phagedenis F0421]QSH99058.1 methyl-accepting chemotaxis protein [Treponema phagedenis]TYT79371.1 methyl-accepting chemotaxis protein [Treponema phagedenis]